MIRVIKLIGMVLQNLLRNLVRKAEIYMKNIVIAVANHWISWLAIPLLPREERETFLHEWTLDVKDIVSNGNLVDLPGYLLDITVGAARIRELNQTFKSYEQKSKRLKLPKDAIGAITCHNDRYFMLNRKYNFASQLVRTHRDMVPNMILHRVSYSTHSKAQVKFSDETLKDNLSRLIIRAIPELSKATDSSEPRLYFVWAKNQDSEQNSVFIVQARNQRDANKFIERHDRWEVVREAKRIEYHISSGGNKFALGRLKLLRSRQSINFGDVDFRNLLQINFEPKGWISMSSY